MDGTYKVRNGTIILSSTLGASKLWINDGELRDEQGKRWLKRIDDTSTQEMTPEEVVRAYVIYLTKTDYEGTRSLIHSDSLYDFPSKVEFEEQLSSESAWEISNFKEIEITDVEIENSTACVEGIIYYKQESSRYPEGMDTSVVFYLAKEYGQWKIVTEEAEPIMDEQEAAETELLNIQSAVTSMMVDNGITELPNPVTIPTNDMSLFPDTSVCGFDKLRDWDENSYVHGQDKDGYILFGHDVTADAKQDELVNYVATQYTSGSYTVDKYGKVTQVTTGYE